MPRLFYFEISPVTRFLTETCVLQFRENRPYGLDEVMSSQRTVPSPPVTVAHVGEP